MNANLLASRKICQNSSARLEEYPVRLSLLLKDWQKFSFASRIIVNEKFRVLLDAGQNAFPFGVRHTHDLGGAARVPFRISLRFIILGIRVSKKSDSDFVSISLKALISVERAAPKATAIRNVFITEVALSSR
jgi:hypothetical protein